MGITRTRRPGSLLLRTKEDAYSVHVLYMCVCERVSVCVCVHVWCVFVRMCGVCECICVWCVMCDVGSECIMCVWCVRCVWCVCACVWCVCVHVCVCVWKGQQEVGKGEGIKGEVEGWEERKKGRSKLKERW